MDNGGEEEKEVKTSFLAILLLVVASAYSVHQASKNKVEIHWSFLLDTEDKGLVNEWVAMCTVQQRGLALIWARKCTL